MSRNVVLGANSPAGRLLISLACLAAVMALAVAFWAGVVWVGQFLLRLITGF